MLLTFLLKPWYRYFDWLIQCCYKTNCGLWLVDTIHVYQHCRLLIGPYYVTYIYIYIIPVGGGMSREGMEVWSDTCRPHDELWIMIGWYKPRIPTLQVADWPILCYIYMLYPLAVACHVKKWKCGRIHIGLTLIRLIRHVNQLARVLLNSAIPQPKNVSGQHRR